MVRMVPMVQRSLLVAGFAPQAALLLRRCLATTDRDAPHRAWAFAALAGAACVLALGFVRMDAVLIAAQAALSGLLFAPAASHRHQGPQA